MWVMRSKDTQKENKMALMYHINKNIFSCMELKYPIVFFLKNILLTTMYMAPLQHFFKCFPTFLQAVLEVASFWNQSGTLLIGVSSENKLKWPAVQNLSEEKIDLPRKKEVKKYCIRKQQPDTGTSDANHPKWSALHPNSSCLFYFFLLFLAKEQKNESKVNAICSGRTLSNWVKWLPAEVLRDLKTRLEALPTLKFNWFALPEQIEVQIF